MTAFTEEERVVDDALGYPKAYAKHCRAGGARSACPTPTARSMPSSPMSSSPTRYLPLFLAQILSNPP